MTKAQAVQEFFSSFGLKAYEENAVPTGDNAPKFPYVTYQLVTDDVTGGNIPIAASLWDYGSSWVYLNNKVDYISRELGLNGKFINCDGGAVWFKKGSPFATSTGDAENQMVKRKKLNITIEYITDY